MADGFGQELNCAGLHGPNRHRDIGVAADEDDGHVHICPGQIIVKIQPTSPRQPDIEHKTSRTVRATTAEELLNRGEQLDTQAYRSEQTLKPLAYLFIVIDDDDSRFSLARPHCPPLSY
jgi:hypothetical protein